jgi:hypothetical protein
MAEARPEGWIYCAGCGNPCRAPAQPGEYACPRCGRRLATGRGGRRSSPIRAAARANTVWRALFVVGVIAIGLLVALGGTVSRVARAEGKTVLAEGLTGDAFALDADAIYTRSFRQVYRQTRSGRGRVTLTGARGGMTSVLLSDGWVYFVTRPWRIFEPVYEIRRVPAKGGPEERVARLEYVSYFPPILAVQNGRLYALANWRGDDETWETRLLRWDDEGQRQTLLLSRGLVRPVVEYLVDPRDPDRVVWLRPDELRPEGERAGALCEASFADGSVRTLLEIDHPHGLARDGDTLCWMNDLFHRPRPRAPGQMPQLRGYSPRTLSPADEVQLQVLPSGARRPTRYTLPSPPATNRGMTHSGHYYWLAVDDTPGERESRLGVFRLSLSGGQISVVSHVRGNSQGPFAWFLRDPSGSLYLYERYLYENWFDWSPQGLSAKQLGRLWRLETD